MFPTTHWSLLAEATLNGDASGREALAALCREYRPPVVAFLRSRGWSDTDAEDLAQDFFVRLLESRAWRRADRNRGRFRTFLLGAVTHVVQHRIERDGAIKRGSGVSAASLDELAENGFEPVDTAEGRESFDREWALRVVEQGVMAVENSFREAGKESQFAVLRHFLPGAPGALSYEDAAAQLGLGLPALKSAVHRLRQDFRDRLRAAVALTVSAPHEVDEELRHLRRVLTEVNAAR